jgi:hypothetical protein
VWQAVQRRLKIFFASLASPSLACAADVSRTSVNDSAAVRYRARGLMDTFLGDRRKIRFPA